MNTNLYDLTGFADLSANAFIEVFPRERAELRIPYRGTIPINYAIAHCWLRFIAISLSASIDSTEDEIFVNFDLTKAPFSELNRVELDDFLQLLHIRSVLWVHETFLRVLSEHAYIFEESEQ